MIYSVAVQRSSVIRHLCFAQDTLTVAFTNGRVCVYLDVPEEDFINLCRARSMGRYFNFNIRGRYNCITEKEFQRGH